VLTPSRTDDENPWGGRTQIQSSPMKSSIGIADSVS